MTASYRRHKTGTEASLSIMFVVKRNGGRQPVYFDKITARLNKLSYGLNQEFCDPVVVAQKVAAGVYNGVSTCQLDELAAETAASMTSSHPDYAVLAARIAVSNLHKNTAKSFVDCCRLLYHYTRPKTGEPAPLISHSLYQAALLHADRLDSEVRYDRDFDFDYFGFKTLERSYLLRIDGKVVERPQHMFMRVALGIHTDDIEAAVQTYHLMSERWFTHASPTLFNAGTPRPQLSSCFLMCLKGDSIDGIYDTLKECALISKSAGGIGLAIHDVRARGSHIHGTNGSSNGIVPMLRVFNDTARYVDQCFEGSTLVCAAAGPKPIRDLVAGVDRVLTHAGQFQPVSRLLAHSVSVSEPTLALRAQHSAQPVTVTETHQVLVVRGPASLDVLRNRLDIGLAQPEMVDARDIQLGDFLCLPVPSQDTEVDLPHLSADDCRFYGLMVGCGHITAHGSGSLRFSGPRSLVLADWVCEHLRGLGVCLVHGLQEEEHMAALVYHIRWDAGDDGPGCKFSAAQLYDTDGQRKIDAAMMNLPQHKLLAIVWGVMDALGVHSNGNNIEVTVASEQVVEALRWMLMRCGILASQSDADDNDSSSSSSSSEGVWRLCIPQEAATYLVHKGWMYSSVQDIQKGHLPLDQTDDDHNGGSATTTVYDLEVEADHTYVVPHMGTVHNGGGKRKGAFAVYLEPWHSDIFDFLDLRKNHGKEETRCRDLFLGLWVNDLFMRRVEDNADWSLFCPSEAPGLADVWGEDFEALYTRYELEGRAKRVVRAQQLWFAILDAQIETGTPYIVYKDACNRKSNQQNLGTIKSSNLCVAPETMLLTRRGWRVIGELQDQEVEVWNGEAWSAVTVRQTGTNQPLLKVRLSNGETLECTPYHKFWVHTSSSQEEEEQPCQVPAAELVPGTPLAQCRMPVVQDADLDLDTVTGYTPPKYVVPARLPLHIKIAWLENLVQDDGTVVVHEGDVCYWKILSSSHDYLLGIKRMLNTMGMDPVVCRQDTEMPHLAALRIYECDLRQLARLGFQPDGLDTCFTSVASGTSAVSMATTTDTTAPFASVASRRQPVITVEAVVDEGRHDDTYCFTEPLRGMGVFNGICTGQCTEIVEYSSPDETAVCNLASLALPRFVTCSSRRQPVGSLAAGGRYFDFEQLSQVTQVATRNLNKIIDINDYPVDTARRSNLRHRPIGLGVQGLADTFILLGLPFDSPAARQLNKDIFECIYYSALKASMELARVDGPYATYPGSPVSRGILQPDMWGVQLTSAEEGGRWDWDGLRRDIAQHGVRNSLLVAPMPTASTSQILGNNEAVEPYTSNLYVRRVLSGEFMVVNQHLLHDLVQLKLWTPQLKNALVAANGSVQALEGVPDTLKALYKTVWEIKQRALVDMATERGAFIDQSQSLNIFISEPTTAKLTSLHFHTWKLGLKTGCYYLRTRAAADAIKFTVDQAALQQQQQKAAPKPVCGQTSEDGVCLMCSA